MNGAELIALGRLANKIDSENVIVAKTRILMETKGKDLYRAHIRGVCGFDEKLYMIEWYEVIPQYPGEKERKIGHIHGFNNIMDTVTYLIKVDKILMTSEHVSEDIFKEE